MDRTAISNRTVETSRSISKKVLLMLETLYEEIVSIPDYVKGVISNDVLMQDTDSEQYRNIITTTLVAISKRSKPLPSDITVQCSSHQEEVVIRAVERMRKRDGHGKSLLTLGFNRMSDNPTAQISTSPGTEYFYPNSNTQSLLTTPWKTLLARVGEHVMQHLLENTALFLFVPPSNYMQISGVPIYDMWPYNAEGGFMLRTQMKQAEKRTKKKYKRTVNRHSHRKAAEPNDIYQEKFMDKRSRKRKQDEDPEEKASSKKRRLTLEKLSSQTNEDTVYKPSTETMDSLSGCSTERETYSTILANSRHEQTPKNLGGQRVEKENKVLDEALHANVKPATGEESNEPSMEGQSFVVQVHSNQAIGRDYLGEEAVESSITNLDKSNDVENIRSSLTVNLSAASNRSKLRKKDKNRKTKKISGDSNDKLKPAVIKNVQDFTTDLSDKKDTKPKRKLRRSKKKKSSYVPESTQPFSYHQYADRASILYVRNLKEQVPNSGVWILEANEQDANKLFEEIFSCTNVGGTVVISDLNPIMTQLVPLLQKLIDLSKKYNFASSVKHYSFRENNDVQDEQSNVKVDVPVAPIFQRGKTNLLKLDVVQMSKQNKKKKKAESVIYLFQQDVSQQKVFLFLRRIIMKVIPQELFGSKSSHNRNVFMRSVRKFVTLNRYEKFCLGQVMTGIKVGECEWAKGGSTHHERVHCVAVVFWWLFTAYIMPLIKSFFYVTDTAVYRNRLFYYRKTLWKRLRQKTVANFINSCMIAALASDRADEIVKNGQSLGISTLRFLPKATSLRPIVNMGRVQLVKGLSINKQLQNLQHVLTELVAKDKHIIGSGIYGIDDIYDVWRKFCMEVKSATDKQKKMYFVKVDIKKCYDTILQEKVFDIVRSLLERHGSHFIVRRWASVFAAHKCLKRAFHRSVSTLKDFKTSFRTFVRSNHMCQKLQNAIIIDQVLHAHEDVASLVEKLRAHVFCNLIQIGRQVYIQKEGISQGAVTSTQLCHLYYGHMEREKCLPYKCKSKECSCQDDLYRIGQNQHSVAGPLMPGVHQSSQYSNEVSQTQNSVQSQMPLRDKKNKWIEVSDTQNSAPSQKLLDDERWKTNIRNDEVFVRMVDDFLFITPYKSHAEQFLSSMLAGFNDYNCFINAEKTVTNVNHADLQAINNQSEWLPWCGLLINISNLEVQADYTRYADVTIRDTITLDMTNKPGQTLAHKLLTAVRSKCHPIFFDPQINSVQTIAINLYKLFLLTAWKFHCCVTGLPKKPLANPTFFIRLILSLSTIFLQQISPKRKQDADILDEQEEDVGGLVLLAYLPMQWLCCQAFIVKLSQHQSIYHLVLKQLRARVRNISKKLHTNVFVLLKASTKTLPTEFVFML